MSQKFIGNVGAVFRRSSLYFFLCVLGASAVNNLRFSLHESFRESYGYFRFPCLCLERKRAFK
jgi:hypothetical protein